MFVVVVRDQFQQRLVDTAEFLGAQVAEIHPPQCAAIARLHQGQCTDRAEQRLVGQTGTCERFVERKGCAVVALGFEDATDPGQG